MHVRRFISKYEGPNWLVALAKANTIMNIQLAPRVASAKGHLHAEVSKQMGGRKRELRAG